MKRLALCAALLCAAAAPALAAPSGYHVLKSVTLGGDGGFDYLNMDPATGYLWITRGSHLMVVDVDAGKVLPTINDGFVGRAPDIGAFEAGAQPRWYGPRPSRFDVHP